MCAIPLTATGVTLFFFCPRKRSNDGEKLIAKTALLVSKQLELITMSTLNRTIAKFVTESNVCDKVLKSRGRPSGVRRSLWSVI